MLLILLLILAVVVIAALAVGLFFSVVWNDFVLHHLTGVHHASYWACVGVALLVVALVGGGSGAANR